MKRLFFAVLVVAALASCAKEEAVRVDQGDAIEFGNAFVDNATRAASDPSYGAQALTEFKVWGTVGATPVAIFAGESVTGTVGEGNVWNCTKTQFWVEGATYNFAALVNGGTVTLGAYLLPATVEFAANGSTDLLYARSAVDIVGQASGQNVPVAFTFQHLLSKVLVKVQNNSVIEGYSFTIKNLKINAPKTAGKYYIQAVDTKPEGTWEATAGDYTFSDIAVSAATAECDAEQLLIPGSATISFDLITNCGGQPIATKPFTHTTTLAAGNSYSFTIITSLGDPIRFKVEQDPAWTNASGTTIQ